jgi:hypothetical protein
LLSPVKLLAYHDVVDHLLNVLHRNQSPKLGK